MKPTFQWYILLLATCTQGFGLLPSADTVHFSQKDHFSLEIPPRTTEFNVSPMRASLKEVGVPPLQDLAQAWATLLMSVEDEPDWRTSVKGFRRDRVVRVLSDQPVIKLEKSGLVSLAGLQLPKAYDSSVNGNCASFTTPTAKLQQLLPPGTNVRVGFIDDDRIPRKAVLVLSSSDGTSLTSVQGEMIRRGYSRVSQKSIDTIQPLAPGLVDEWIFLENDAKNHHLGPMHRSCSAEGTTTAPMAEFQPLEYTVQTDWREDGGRPVRRRNPDFDNPQGTVRPANPGDVKGCSDFRTYEDALRWYETYFPWYGDVARLDRDGDGVPCPGLPHTKDGEKYRMKKPTVK